MKKNKRYKWGLPSRAAVPLVSWQGWGVPAVNWLVLPLLLALACWVVVMPLDGKEQLTFGLLVLALVFYLRTYAGSYITLVLVALSAVVSTRYLYWRATETLNITTWVDAMLSIGLLIAEFYAWLILVMGLFQSIWPLNRESTPLPEDTSLWPTVDVLIPTYNEPLDVVRTTVIAATLLEWPADKLKVYILDDGRRDVLFSVQN